jgi:hypothetical protein
LIVKTADAVDDPLPVELWTKHGIMAEGGHERHVFEFQVTPSLCNTDRTGA